MNIIKSQVARLLVENVKTPIPTETINTVAGSTEGTRRLRELRAEGWPIRVSREGRQWFYTLTRTPAKKLTSQYI